MFKIYRALGVLGLLSALYSCTTNESIKNTNSAVGNRYSEPQQSGLVVDSPYPTEKDVCVSLKSNDVTKPFEKENHFLIACPKHELGAIEDRESQQNAKVVGDTGVWVVVSVPKS